MGQTDLTRGSILKSLVKYSIPLVLSSILQAMYGIVDTIVAGQFIGAEALSGLTNANSVITMATQIVFGICNGGSMLIGQYYGSKDRENTRQASVTLFTGGLAAGVFIAALLFFTSHPFLTLLGAPAIEQADIYLRVCAVGFFFVAGYNACAAALRAVGNSRAPLICIAATALTNVALDILFVVGLHMGVFGAALATAVSQGISFVVATVYLLRDRETFGLYLSKLRLYPDKLKQELKLGIPCAVQMSVAAFSWLSVTYFINSYGVAVSAGNGVSYRIKEFCQLTINTMATAAASMVAQNLGARQYDRARTTMYTAMKLTVGVALCIIAAVEVFAPTLVGLFTPDAATAAAAVRNLRFEIIGQIFYASFLVYHSLMVGSGDTWYAFWSSFINCILMRVSLGALFNHIWGLDGLYIACMIAPFSSVPFGLWYERSNRWRKTLVNGSGKGAGHGAG